MCLGGHFGPEKKYLASPQKSPIRRRHPPSPSETPLLGFSLKNRPPASWRLGLPLFPPRAEQKKFEMSTKLYSLSFLSLVFWNSLVNFKRGISLLKWVFSLVFPKF